ncbi:MAG: EAL domain-containing protein [Hydrogenophaga sp.]|nr:EAL domain-containing protein [Hydrogenophaga sp.]
MSHFATTVHSSLDRNAESAGASAPGDAQGHRLGIRRANANALLAFVLVVGIGVYTTIQYTRTEQLNIQQQLAKVVSGYASHIQQLIDRTLSATFALAGSVKQSQGHIEDVDSLAQELFPFYAGIDSIQLARNGVVHFVYPPQAGEKVMGLDVLNDPSNRDEAQFTVRYGNLHVAVPSLLKQGGVGFVGRYPIFLKDHNRNQTFWGFASAVVMLDTLKAVSKLADLESQGVTYQLWRINPITGNKQVLLESAPKLEVATVNAKMLVHETSWTLSAAPAARSWTNAPLAIGIALSLLLGTGVALLVRYILLQPIKLAKLVRDRTQDLQQSNRKLQREFEVRKAYEVELRKQATHDALTGLGNRTLLDDRITRAIAQLQQGDKDVAILLLDLDHFKNINDSLGHRVGDRILQRVAKLLMACVSDSDSVCRLGGDEFVILLTNAQHADHVATIAENIVETLRQPHVIDDMEFHVSASLGIAMCPQDANTSDALLSQADMAMYRAKQGGRNRFEFFSTELDSQAKMRLHLEDELRRALRLGEFEVHYQLKVGLSDGEIVGVESLVRWRHPTRGMVFPAEFIPIAEDSGLIVPLGEWVLRTACAQARKWIDLGGPRISVAVNISAKQFQDEALLAKVTAALQDAGLPPDYLELEVTESLMMHKPEEATNTMQALRKLGVSLSLDDFGTGYSSLTYLQRFPLQYLKIDRSFISHALENASDAAIVRAVIAMGKALNLTIIAEGVETQAQLALLKNEGCDIAQGYLLGRPTPAEEITNRLRPVVESTPRGSC